MSEAGGGSRADMLRGLFADLAERSRTLHHEVMAENERLRVRIQELESDMATAQHLLTHDWSEIEKDRDRLRREAATLEAENRDFAQRYVELEERSTSLANLYAATFQLHSTLDPSAVIQCIVEVALNLIGAAEFILYLADETKGDFVVVAREGELPPKDARIPAPLLPIETAAIGGRRTVFAEDAQAPPGEPICCAPLFFHERLVGVLTIYALLSHKKSFSQLDRELFDLLGEQAAVALVSSQAYVSVDRKLRTVKRFMDLLKS